MEIEWKEVSAYEGFYKVSNHGNVIVLPRSWASGKDYLNVRSNPEKELKQKTTHLGYKTVTLRAHGKSKTWFVHVLVARAFISNPENKSQVNHKNGNKKDNRASELEWVTCSENHLHAFRIGLRSITNPTRGTKSPAAKLTEDQAKVIKMSPLSTRKLAKVYGVHHSIIGGIKSGKRWAHV